MSVRADGSGNWLLPAQIDECGGSSEDYKYGVGFIFKFSTSKTTALGMIQASREPTDGLASVAVGGKDHWITEHWPELFA